MSQLEFKYSSDQQHQIEAIDATVNLFKGQLFIKSAIADRGPRRVFMLDSILTDTLKLNAVQIFKRGTDKTGVEIELRTV